MTTASRPDEAVVVILGASIAVIGSVSLTLAMVGAWSLPAVIAASANLVAAVLALAYWRRGSSQPATEGAARSWTSALVILPGIVLSLALVLPGFEFAMAGWDPGVYQNHAISIAETGDLDRENPAATLGLTEEEASPRFPGVPPNPDRWDRLNFSFFHIYPALGAVAQAALPEDGMSLVNPALALLAVAAVALALRRLLNTAVALVATVILSTNAVWIWHARLPSSEMLTASMTASALLAGALAWDTRNRSWWLAAAACATAAANSRLDGYFLLGLAAAALAALVLADRARDALWLAAGLLPGTGLWFAQAIWSAPGYTGHRAGSQPLKLAAPLVLLPLGALAVRYGLPRVTAAVVRGLVRWQRPLVAAGFAAVLVMGTVFWIRHLQAPPAVEGDENSFDPHTIWRIVLLIGPVATAAIVAAVGVLGGRVRDGLRLLPFLLPGLATLPVYLLDPVIHPRLIWATRRYVPFIWVPVLVLVAVGVAAPVVRFGSGPHGTGWRRWLAGAVTGVLLAGVVGYQVDLDRLIRDHRELAGSEDFASRIGDVVEGGVVLWVDGWSFDAFASTLLVREDLEVVPVAVEDLDTTLPRLRELAPGRTVFVVSDLGDPAVDAELRTEPIATVTGSYPYLGFTFFRLPDTIEQLEFLAEVREYAPSP